MRLRRSRWLIGLLIGAVGLTAQAYLAWPAHSTFTISPETTYFTAPLDADGYVDYVAALNERLKRGVTAANNANVLIWKAIGPHPEEAAMAPEYFKWLDIEPPAEEGKYFIAWGEYENRKLKLDPEAEPGPTFKPASPLPGQPWKSKDRPDLAGWLKVNETSLAMAIEASARTEYFNPMLPERGTDGTGDFSSAKVPNLQQSRFIADALVCRALNRIAEGQINSGWQDLIACHRLGRLVAQGTTLIDFLLGGAIDQLASQADLQLLDHVELPSKQIMSHLETLNKLPPFPTLAQKIDLGERIIRLDVVQLARSSSLRNRSLFSGFTTPSINWDPTFRTINRGIDRLVAALNASGRETRLQLLAALDEDLATLAEKADAAGFWSKLWMGAEDRGSALGDRLAGTLILPLIRVNDAQDRRDQVERNLHIAFALAAYRRDHGKYPDHLADLSPRYLKSIPDDLFSQRPVIYRLVDKGYLLYSVGPNGEDDDGRDHSDYPRGDDVRIRMPVPRTQTSN